MGHLKTLATQCPVVGLDRTLLREPLAKRARYRNYGPHVRIELGVQLPGVRKAKSASEKPRRIRRGIRNRQVAGVATDHPQRVDELTQKTKCVAKCRSLIGSQDSCSLKLPQGFPGI